MIIEKKNIGLHSVMLRLKRRTVAATAFFVLLFISVYRCRLQFDLPSELPAELPTEFDLIPNRLNFKNPVYQRWDEREVANTMEENCRIYFKHLLDSKYLLLAGKEFDSTIYKRSKWIQQEVRNFKKELRQKGIKMDHLHMLEVEKRYIKEALKASELEQGFTNDVSHMRVFGKCLTDSKTLDSCSAISAALFPWFLGDMPSIELWHTTEEQPLKKSGCLPKQLIEGSEGQGIVIPLLPGKPIHKQVSVAVRLIQVLRALDNNLPIQIVYFDDEALSSDDKLSLLQSARQDAQAFPISVADYLRLSGIEEPELVFPKQELSFINLKSVVASDYLHIRPNFALSLATLFNTFEEFVFLSTQTIPLLHDIQSLFENPDYKTHGTLFFKLRAIFEYKPSKFPTGFFEINELVNKYATVQPEDIEYFKLQLPNRAHTNRVRDSGFQHLLDPSMIVMNKKKTLSGLLLSSALQFYPLLSSKYDFSKDVNGEFLWLGQELAGTRELVNFNKHFGAVAGVLTPPENLPAESTSRELCSSSWAQLYDTDDHTIVYVTSHQLENRLLPEFGEALMRKFSTGAPRQKSYYSTTEEDEEGVPMDVDDTLAVNTVNKNPLYIKSLLQTIAVEKPYITSENEPRVPWIEQELFGSLNDYWCAYDVVGSASLPDRGLVIDYSEKTLSWFNFLLDLWLVPTYRRGSKIVLLE